MTPIFRTLHPAVFDRIEVNVVDMMLQIRIVADRVFPEAALPDATLAF